MIVKLLGLVDLLAALCFLLVQWGVFENFAVVIAIILLIKSLIFISDFTSIIDLISALYLFLVIFNIHSAFAFIFVLWLLQKAIFSLFV